MLIAKPLTRSSLKLSHS